MSEEINNLRKQIDELESKLITLVMKEEAEEENPYSRLIALEKMKVVEDYNQIRSKSIAIIGIGGIGSVASEMLVRCGIGTIKLFDFDTVSTVNMNRMFFLPTQIGMSKVEAARSTLLKINPKVNIEVYSYNITKTKTFEDFLVRISDVDVVLSCVDNFSARIAINRACLIKNKIWFESGVSETAVNGHIQFLVPGKSGCYECAPPLEVVTNLNNDNDNDNQNKSQNLKITHEQECTASLPTTMAIIGGLMIQNVLKYLLDFGEVSWFLGFNSLHDFFPKMMVKPNYECRNKDCRKLQKIYNLQQKEIEKKKNINITNKKKKKKIIHENNSWGIEVIEKSEIIERKEITKGIKYQFIKDEKKKNNEKTEKNEIEEDLDSLFEKLNSLEN